MIDLHTHSSVSDGTDTPAELVAKAAAAGLDTVALTDHDTFDGLGQAAAAAAPAGIRLVPGIEISAEREGASVHLLGYFCDVANPALAAELAKIREGRGRRIPAMLDKLAALGMPVSEQEVAAQAGDAPSVGRPHVADALVAKGYAASRDEVFSRWLADDGPAFVPRYSVPLERGIDLVHAAGGVAVIAHPWSRVSRTVLDEDVLTRLAAGHGLDGIEADHLDHDEATRQELYAIARRAGLLVTGGSDYHGAGKTGHDLGSRTTTPGVLAQIERRATAEGTVRLAH